MNTSAIPNKLNIKLFERKELLVSSVAVTMVVSPLAAWHCVPGMLLIFHVALKAC
jgi:hypothetical protein